MIIENSPDYNYAYGILESMTSKQIIKTSYKLGILETKLYQKIENALLEHYVNEYYNLAAAAADDREES